MMNNSTTTAQTYTNYRSNDASSVRIDHQKQQRRKVQQKHHHHHNQQQKQRESAKDYIRKQYNYFNGKKLLDNNSSKNKNISTILHHRLFILLLLKFCFGNNSYYGGAVITVAAFHIVPPTSFYTSRHREEVSERTRNSIFQPLQPQHQNRRRQRPSSNSIYLSKKRNTFLPMVVEEEADKDESKYNNDYKLFEVEKVSNDSKNIDSIIDLSFQTIAKEFRNLSLNDIQKKLAKKGIEFRLREEQQQQEKYNEKESENNDTTASTTNNNRIIQESQFEKVKGCVSNVYIKTILRTELLSNNNNENEKSFNINESTNNTTSSSTNAAAMVKTTISFSGSNADALLSAGLLALLTDALSSLSSYQLSKTTSDGGDSSVRNTIENILKIDPDRVADQLGIRQALSPGRNDGLSNMMSLIQKQTRSLLLYSRSNDFTIDDNSSKIDIKTTSEERLGDEIEKKSSTELPLQQHNKNSNIETMIGASSSNKKKKKTIALLLSGGVDSSVALHLLLQENKYNITAFYLKIWLEDEVSHLGECPWEDDYRMCERVCEQAGVPLESISLQKEYHHQIISYTIEEARKGRTPNPDILCNSRIKFGCFYEFAIDNRKFDYIASGHYAKIIPSLSSSSSIRLYRAPDPVKDQSYFLCALNQKQLKRVLFPIGHLQKVQVREYANQFLLPNRDRPDSQGLCFLGKVKFSEFIQSYLGTMPGDIIDTETGLSIGKHRGVWYHTVGQRKGIGNSLNPIATAKGPWYVVAKDPSKNIVYCSNRYDEDSFVSTRSQFTVEDIRWINGGTTTTDDGGNGGSELSGKRYSMKIRHGPRLVEGKLTMISNSTGDVELDIKDGGLAPGQFVVFYKINDSECLGCGVISERHWLQFISNRNSDVIVAGR